MRYNKTMKRFLIFLIMLFIFIPSANTETSSVTEENISQVLKIDIKTLKYEQKQLVYAIITGNELAVKTILDSDSEPRTTYAKIPLTMFAIHSNNVNILKLLVEYGFDPDETIMDVTPIELAIALKKYDSIEYLLSIGVKLTEDDYSLIYKSKDNRLKELFK